MCPLGSAEQPCKASSTDASKGLLLWMLLARHPSRALLGRAWFLSFADQCHSCLAWCELKGFGFGWGCEAAEDEAG